MTLESDKKNLTEIRKTVLKMVFNGNEGHLPSSFSILEIIFVLYKYCLTYNSQKPTEKRDYFVLSKGHASTGLYAILANFGFFDRETLLTYCQQGSILGGHPDALKVPGVEVSSGSLGHGISIATGIAMGLQLKKLQQKVVVLVGDGEMDEGSFWESMMMAKNRNLNNLIVIADCNQSQKYSFLFDFQKILSAMGFSTFDINGHSLHELKSTLIPLVHHPNEKPVFIKARTIKGYNLKHFVNNPAWHRRTPSKEEFDNLYKELE